MQGYHEEQSARSKGACLSPLEIPGGAKIRDAEMTIKIIFEMSSQKGGSAGGSKRGSTGDPS